MEGLRDGLAVNNDAGKEEEEMSKFGVNMVEVIGMDTNNTLVVQFSADGTNWTNEATPVTGAANYLFNSAALADVELVRPRYIRLVATATANDPGVVTVNVTGKHIPSTLRKS
jgi:hypothetical protein